MSAATVKGRQRLNSTRPPAFSVRTEWQRDGLEHDQLNISGRGHDLENGHGPSAGQGQLAQARDRDFDSVFVRSREAIAKIKENAASASCCHAAFADLGETTHHVEHMLRHMEVMFPGDTNRTIVSLKHLCVQLESSASVCAIYCHLPKLSSLERVCGGTGRLKALATEGEGEIGKQTKAITTYATALLLEHGFSRSELREFCERKLPSPTSMRDREAAAQTPNPSGRNSFNSTGGGTGRESFGGGKGNVKFSSVTSSMDRLPEVPGGSGDDAAFSDSEMVSTHPSDLNTEAEKSDSFKGRERKSSIDKMFKNEGSMGIMM